MEVSSTDWNERWLFDVLQAYIVLIFLLIFSFSSHIVCRTKDIRLASSFNKDKSGSSGGLKERPKLNLTVKKELQGMGGKIMAQSRMAKGPDGTNGFVHGWTSRLSPNVKSFVPPDIESINTSGFESNTEAEATTQQVEVEVESMDANEAKTEADAAS